MATTSGQVLNYYIYRKYKKIFPDASFSSSSCDPGKEIFESPFYLLRAVIFHQRCISMVLSVRAGQTNRQNQHRHYC